MRSSLTSSKTLQWTVDDSNKQYSINSKSQLVNVPTELTNLEISKYTLTSKIASLKKYYSQFYKLIQDFQEKYTLDKSHTKYLCK